MTRELPIPPDVETASESVELIRGWLIDGGLQCSLFPTLWKDSPEAWGILLADAAQHIADAIASETNSEPTKILQSIQRALTDELSSPSAEREGEFVEQLDA
jgi:hypothetical protein